jgi:hypothetical protein
MENTVFRIVMPHNFENYWYLDCLENVGASTSHNPKGLQGL